MMIFDVLAIVAIVLSTIAILLSGIAVATLVGLKNSTHKIQYVPIDPDAPTGESLAKEFKEKIYNDEDYDLV